MRILFTTFPGYGHFHPMVPLAAAAVEECDFLLTWNFRHIANVRIRREIERILATHGYTKTTICTPEELV